jgi:hypothetical protein
MDPISLAQNKLEADWSADRYVPFVTADHLRPLLADTPALVQLDAEVKTRMLIASLLAVGKLQPQDNQKPPEAAKAAEQREQVRGTPAVPAPLPRHPLDSSSRALPCPRRCGRASRLLGDPACCPGRASPLRCCGVVGSGVPPAAAAGVRLHPGR